MRCSDIITAIFTSETLSLGFGLRSSANKSAFSQRYVHPNRLQSCPAWSKRYARSLSHFKVRLIPCYLGRSGIITHTTYTWQISPSYLISPPTAYNCCTKTVMAPSTSRQSLGRNGEAGSPPPASQTQDASGQQQQPQSQQRQSSETPSQAQQSGSGPPVGPSSEVSDSATKRRIKAGPRTSRACSMSDFISYVLGMSDRISLCDHSQLSKAEGVSRSSPVRGLMV